MYHQLRRDTFQNCSTGGSLPAGAPKNQFHGVAGAKCLIELFSLCKWGLIPQLVAARAELLAASVPNTTAEGAPVAS